MRSCALAGASASTTIRLAFGSHHSPLSRSRCLIGIGTGDNPDRLLALAHAIAELQPRLEAGHERRVGPGEGDQQLVAERQPRQTALRADPRPPLPDQGIVITQDLVYNGVHLFVADRRFDTWAAVIEQYKQLPHDAVLPGHGPPGGKQLYDQVLDYLAAAKPAVEEATAGEQLKTTLTKRFPDHRGVSLLDIQNMYLFPPAA